MCEPGKVFVPLAEAAHLLQATEMRVLMMLKKNELTGRQEEGVWVIDKASLLLCRKPEPADVARPGGCGGRCGTGCGVH